MSSIYAAILHEFGWTSMTVFCLLPCPKLVSLCFLAIFSHLFYWVTLWFLHVLTHCIVETGPEASKGHIHRLVDVAGKKDTNTKAAGLPKQKPGPLLELTSILKSHVTLRLMSLANFLEDLSPQEERWIFRLDSIHHEIGITLPLPEIRGLQILPTHREAQLLSGSRHLDFLTACAAYVN